jgi:predicted NACHT family NTPase
MAEFGLITSITTVAGASAKLSLTLFQLADSIGSAGHEARLVGTEISLFSQSLNAVSKSLGRQSAESARLQEIAVVLYDACRGLLKDLKTLLEDVPVSVLHKDGF